MHGGRSPGAPRGEKHPNYRTGRYTRETKEARKFFRGLARDVDVKTATVMREAGLRPPKAIRRKAHVRRALKAAREAKAKAAEGTT